jgi:hypothetical protein
MRGTLPGCRWGCFFRYLHQSSPGYSLHMSTMPHFVHSREEWVTWLLADEFGQNATIEMLSNRMELPPEQVFHDVRLLKRRGAVMITGSEHHMALQSEVGLTTIGKSFYTKIKARSNTRFDKLSENY